MFKLGKFANIITNFDQLNYIQIWCFYLDREGNFKPLMPEDIPAYYGYVDDMPYKFLTTDYRIPTEKEIEIITDGNADRPFGMFVKTEDSGMVKAVLEVYLICAY